MKKIQIIILFVISSFLFQSCLTTALIGTGVHNIKENNALRELNNGYAASGYSMQEPQCDWSRKNPINIRINCDDEESIRCYTYVLSDAQEPRTFKKLKDKFPLNKELTNAYITKINGYYFLHFSFYDNYDKYGNYSSKSPNTQEYFLDISKLANNYYKLYRCTIDIHSTATVTRNIGGDYDFVVKNCKYWKSLYRMDYSPTQWSHEDINEKDGYTITTVDGEHWKIYKDRYNPDTLCVINKQGEKKLLFLNHNHLWVDSIICVQDKKNNDIMRTRPRDFKHLEGNYYYKDMGVLSENEVKKVNLKERVSIPDESYLRKHLKSDFFSTRFGSTNLYNGNIHCVQTGAVRLWKKDLNHLVVNRNEPHGDPGYIVTSDGSIYRGEGGLPSTTVEILAEPSYGLKARLFLIWDGTGIDNNRDISAHCKHLLGADIHLGSEYRKSRTSKDQECYPQEYLVKEFYKILDDTKKH